MEVNSLGPDFLMQRTTSSWVTSAPATGFASLWLCDGNAAFMALKPGDLEAALAAATAIGDDRLQQQAQGRIVPESFTHGSSEQRVRWFKRGFETGDINQCNTFKAARL